MTQTVVFFCASYLILMQIITFDIAQSAFSTSDGNQFNQSSGQSGGTMDSILPVFFTIYAIFLQAILWNAASVASIELDNNGTHRGSSWELSRSRRSTFEEMPKELRIHVKYETGKTINLKWMKRSKYLASEHLPVITPLLHPNKNVMKEHGDFVVYQDIATCSAVVYFKKSNSFFGIIGLNHYITDLPFLFNDEGNYPDVVGEPYVMKRVYTPVHVYPVKIITPLHDVNVHEEFPEPSGVASDSSLTRPSDSDPGPSSKRQRTEENFDENNIEKLINMHDMDIVHSRNRRERGFDQIYHIEILVFVTKDVIEIFKENFGEDHYIERIVNYYIVYFNTVDMMFQKLYVSHLKVRMNIAKIEIEDELSPFDFMTDNDLEFEKIVQKVPEYLRTYPSAYLPDSFDLVFISTNRPILHQSIQVHGATKYGEDLHAARTENKFYDAVPITLLGFQEDYAVAVQEIGRIMNMKIEPWLKGLRCGAQCYSVMQRGSSRCDDCLRWSHNNVRQFKAFFSDNPNRCFLSNYPRSVLPPGATRLTSPHRQCQCIGYDTYKVTAARVSSSMVGADGCSKNLACDKVVGSETHRRFTVRPFDGTPCTTHKACWEGKCVPATTSRGIIRT